MSDKARAPMWFNPWPYGEIKIGITKKEVSLNARGFRVMIQRKGAEGYVLHLTATRLGTLRIKIRMDLSRIELMEIFGIFERDKEGHPNRRLLARLDADVLKEGFYVRKGIFLSIPGPGHGYENDTTATGIILTGQIRSVIEEFLK